VVSRFSILSSSTPNHALAPIASRSLVTSC
jgi:hypothetical protein